SSRRRHTRWPRDWSSDVCSSDLRESVVPDEVEYQCASVDLRRSFLTELILSGDLDRITTDLMARLAARCAGQEPAPEAIAAEEQIGRASCRERGWRRGGGRYWKK